MTRQEHLDWAKKRAIELLDRGDTMGAMTSMFSDLGMHPELADHIGIELGAMQMFAGLLNSPSQVRHFIEGFN